MSSEVTPVGTASASLPPAPGPVAPVGRETPAPVLADPGMEFDGASFHAVFDIDPDTHAVHISVVDAAGTVVRRIPAETVAEMLRLSARPAR